LLAAAFPRFGLPAFAWIALAPLVVAAVLAQRASAAFLGRPFRLGLVTGIVYFAGTLYWVVEVMGNYGGLPVWVAVVVAFLLVAYLALYVGAFAALVALSARRYGLGGVWLAPCFWVATEWARSWVGGGFPWVLLGTSQATVLPVAQLASVTGVFGLSALVALVSTAAAIVALRRGSGQWRGAIVVAGILAVVVTGGAFRIAGGGLARSGAVLRVGLVQGNVLQDQKWDPAYRESILQRYVDLSRQAIGAGAQLVIWPEASTPFYFDLESALAAPVRKLAADTRTPFLLGTDEYVGASGGEPDRYFNAAVLVGPDGISRGSYRKMHLVPFGEYVPLKSLLFFVGRLVQAVSDFSAGTDPVVFEIDGGRLSVAICYESVYPWIARTFVQQGSELLATITNDAWFGTSSAAYQHFEQGALRAIEEGRYVVRAANTGITGAVDPYGRVIARTSLFEPVAITVDVRLLDDRTIYGQAGDVIAWLSMAVTLWAILFGAGAARRRAA
jgi:apolipoprotein N-acyltransferase